MNSYLESFIDNNYPEFLDKYLKTKTMLRLKKVTQFCGCDYTKLYNPRFLYTRFDHSLVVAHMTWHFTHDKKETIVSLLHDIGTPCFAHTIDYVFGDYLKQESSERNLLSVISKDEILIEYLKSDGINLDDFEDFSKYEILENKSPGLCTDRLDGVLHTCYIWLHTNSLEEIREVYSNITMLINEDGKREIGFKDLEIASKFVSMVMTYATELQGNKDKFVMQFISLIVKKAVSKNLITLDDLYSKGEDEICSIFDNNFKEWSIFCNEAHLVNTETKSQEHFYISFDTKKRNVIPLILMDSRVRRINQVSSKMEYLYEKLNEFKDRKYAYMDGISNEIYDEKILTMKNRLI